MGEKFEPSPEEAGEELVGKEVIFKETPNTERHSIRGMTGRIEKVLDEDKLYVLCTDQAVGPAGPFEMSMEDVEIQE